MINRPRHPSVTKERPNDLVGIVLNRAPMLQQPPGGRHELPLRRVGQAAPGLKLLPKFIDDRRWVESRCLGRKVGVEHHTRLR